ncbi:MAG: SAM-dependent methyltransferase [Flavobacteriaceae bacterium]|nr:SAM-dependent methyltransferase [Flavobacteriaceae bacterium]|tara:strand:- start:1486 stop:2073 length:588 start_codon:yes stop_codon:yes gene_type:complete
MNLLDKFHHWRRKIRWNKQYKEGRWDSLQSEKEAKRYETIICMATEFGPENPSVLDIGSGDGVLTERFGADRYGYFLGVDFSKVSIEKAKAKNLKNAEFETADAITFQPKQKFDVIVFNEAFYYIHDSEKQNVLDRMLNSLTERGIIITSIYREGHGCWEYFKENENLNELSFETVTTDEELRYWKIGAYVVSSG